MIRPVVAGLATYIPGLYPLLRKGTGGTNSAFYCYGVWLKHLTLAWSNGLRQIPHTVAELGPGDSLGIGLATLLAGASRYYAFDVITYARTDRNVRVFDELVQLFRRQAGVSGDDGWPAIAPYLDANGFPSHILTREHLQQALREERVLAIRRALQGLDGGKLSGIEIRYVAPWHQSDELQQASVDLILSHAVLEHVEDLPTAYRAMYSWLKPRGFMSHQIDFRCHGLAAAWNGHWAYSDFVWRLIKGNRPYLLNRQPHSVHVRLLQQAGFRLVCNLQQLDSSGLRQEQLAPRWRQLADADVACSGAFIQAARPG